MSLWLDASVLVALITREPMSHRIDALLERSGAPLVSDFCVAECSAAVARLVRTGIRTVEDAEALYHDMDVWVAGAADRLSVDQGDIEMATSFVRQPGIALRAPDAIHIAAAHRLGATILTLDRGMARAAAALGVPYINPAEAEAPGEQKI